VAAVPWPARHSRRWLATIAALLVLAAALAWGLTRWPHATGSRTAPTSPTERAAPSPLPHRALPPPAPVAKTPEAVAHVPPTRMTVARPARTPAPPAPSAAPTPATFRLSAIGERDGHRVAMINDRFVQEGDVFDGARVVRIGDAEVELELEGRRVIVGF